MRLPVCSWWTGRKRKGGIQLNPSWKKQWENSSTCSPFLFTQGAPSSWQWRGNAEDALYCALYPRAWTVYNIPKVRGYFKKMRGIHRKLVKRGVCMYFPTSCLPVLKLAASRFKLVMFLRRVAAQHCSLLQNSKRFFQTIQTNHHDGVFAK